MSMEHIPQTEPGSQYSDEEKERIEIIRIENGTVFQQRANAINEKNTSLWEQIRGKNQISGNDLIHEEALAIEAERVKRQAEMDAEEIDKIRNNLAGKRFGYEENTGDNTIVAGIIGDERVAERNKAVAERNLQRANERQGTSTAEALGVAALVNTLLD